LNRRRPAAIIHRMSERRYAVTGAILTQRGDETVWQLTFTPQPPEPGAPPDPDGDREIVIALPPADVDNMFFDATYTRADIDALRSGS
jgi:hypothetical protein